MNLATTLFVALALLTRPAEPAAIQRARYLMGTVCEAAVGGPEAERGIDAAFAEAERIEEMLSTWREDSELSRYRGNSGQDASFGGRVSLAEVHADANVRGFSLRGLAARGTVADAAAINAANKLAGNASVGERFGGWYVEGGYDVAGMLGRSEVSLTPFARYEQFDTQVKVPMGFTRNPANDQNILTIGVAFKPIAQTVIKLDWQDVENEAGTGLDQWNIALGYIF